MHTQYEIAVIGSGNAAEGVVHGLLLRSDLEPLGEEIAPRLVGVAGDDPIVEQDAAQKQPVDNAFGRVAAANDGDFILRVQELASSKFAGPTTVFPSQLENCKAGRALFQT